MPFLLSGVLVLVGMGIRLAVGEVAGLHRDADGSRPKRRAVSRRSDPRRVQVSLRAVLIAIGARFAENIWYYVITAFVVVYPTKVAGRTPSRGR